MELTDTVKFHRSGPVEITYLMEDAVRELPFPHAMSRLPYGPCTPRQQVRTHQRTRLCLAMGDALRKKGSLKDVTVELIVKLSGVSRRCFYEYFGDKLDCFLWSYQLSINRIGTDKSVRRQEAQQLRRMRERAQEAA